jgi:hypothetical protein
MVLSVRLHRIDKVLRFIIIYLLLSSINVLTQGNVENIRKVKSSQILSIDESIVITSENNHAFKITKENCGIERSS